MNSWQSVIHIKIRNCRDINSDFLYLSLRIDVFSIYNLREEQVHVSAYIVS